MDKKKKRLDTIEEQTVEAETSSAPPNSGKGKKKKAEKVPLVSTSMRVTRSFQVKKEPIPKAKNQEYVPTPFAIQSINAGDDLPSALLQVLSFQKMQNTTDDTDRHKLVLSDGKYMQLAILPSKYATLIDSDILKIGTIIQLSSYTCRYIWNTRTIIILSLEVKQSVCPFFGKPEYLFKEQQPEIMSEDRPSTSKRSLQITCFDEIAKLHYNRVDIGSHYIISKGSVKEANARYNKLNSHLEITLFDTSIVKRCTNEEQAYQQTAPFTPIGELFQLTNNTMVDVIGLVLYVGDIIPIHRKDGSQTQKRVVKINDLSGSTIDINLWGPIAEQKGSGIEKYVDQ
ncbi:replication protein A 70 kDa DNA-binding subunit E-like [Cryptomeria japonica]|uniref:replication protein A 70 kDa DNA-binding subunit E-like n=1 Tax=Cryptomeria japonica TaxID=3369 RepID=UPI0027D9D9BF|nr:replication protein A 70 kDa DNA-binding subunit E-like [Cryptomeria japonica]